MLITTHFVFLHYPRTGGVFVRRACRELLPEGMIVAELEETHAGVAQIPEEYRHLPAICLIRNPWDWYVSWYRFVTRFWAPDSQRKPPERPTHPWATLFGSGRNDFRQTVVNACTRRDGNREFEVIMRELDCDVFSAMFFQISGHFPPEAAGVAVEPIRAAAAGVEVEVGRYETLREDLIGFIERHDIPAGDAFIEGIRERAPRHASERGPYREYFDDDLRDLVARNARFVIAEYGYEF